MRALLHDGRRSRTVAVPDWVRLRAEPHGDEIRCECMRCGTVAVVRTQPRGDAERQVGAFALYHDRCRERSEVPPKRLGPQGPEFVTYVQRVKA